MQQKMVVRGVPKSLALDGWWLNAEPEVLGRQAAPRMAIKNFWSDRSKRRLALFVALLALADFLFFRQAVGVSIALFCIAVFGASLFEEDSRRVHLGPVVLMILSILPVIEYLQFTSVCFAIFGTVTAVAWNRVGGARSIALTGYAARRLLALVPVEVVASCFRWAKLPSVERDFGGLTREFVKNWAFPLGGGAVILSLLVQANPILEGWLDGLFTLNFDLSTVVMRVLFWGGMALVLWPLLSVTADRLEMPTNTLTTRKEWRFGLNVHSVTNALWVFNGLLALQLVLDGQFFWTGALPEGISYARYAHRGAYPLLVTALLAGGFALAARPFLAESKHLKILMMVWLGLNVMLTLSSMARLDLYVEAYGLTYLRVRAGIWMVLVAIWLGMIAWQIWREKQNSWLVVRSLGLGIGVVYLCSFVNFAEVIVRHNVEIPRLKGHAFCFYVSASKTAYDQSEQGSICMGRNLDKPQIQGWRDWDYRTWRLDRYKVTSENIAWEDSREITGG